MFSITHTNCSPAHSVKLLPLANGGNASVKFSRVELIYCWTKTSKTFCGYLGKYCCLDRVSVILEKESENLNFVSDKIGRRKYNAFSSEI